MIIVATNVAETSLTIPNVRYVVDCGRSKEKLYDTKLQVSKFAIQWISRASAEQRTGRAGRTGPGQCYRLYSSALFSKMDEFSDPEILKAPLDQTILQLKAIGTQNIFKFPFVTMPETGPIKAALRHLTILGALDVVDRRQIDNLLGVRKSDGKLTSDPTRVNKLGSLLSKVPLSPKFAKMLVVALKYDLAHFAIMMVACMSVSELFSETNNTMNQVV